MRRVVTAVLLLSTGVPAALAGTPSLGRAPVSRAAPAGRAPAGVLGSLAYGADVLTSPEDLVSFDVGNPGGMATVATVRRFLSGMDLLPSDPDTLYAVDFDTAELVRLDRLTGSLTVVGPATPPVGQVWTGLAGAPGDVLYGVTSDCASSTLVTVDPATAAVTVVGTITGGPCLVALAADAAGSLYALDILNDTLVAVDPATGAGSTIGPLGYDANYAQGLDVNPATGTLYVAAYNDTLGRAELRIADPATGATTLVGPFPGGTEVDGLAITSIAAPTPTPVPTSTPTPTPPPGATPTPTPSRGYGVPVSGPRGAAALAALLALAGAALLLRRTR